MNIEEKIRSGQAIQYDKNIAYRGVFIDGNFYLYQLIEKEFQFQGDTFNDDTLVLVYSYVRFPQNEVPPTNVRVRA
jgi:hypothetical protein